MSVRRNEFMQIGQISKQTGVSIDAIRFYERNGLLAAPPRSGGGFRLYSSTHLSTLQFICNLQTLGFSLNEIREFLSLRGNDLQACSKVRKMLGHKLARYSRKTNCTRQAGSGIERRTYEVQLRTQAFTWKAERPLPSSNGL
jgi:MerR family mercuric resistance operon transcriptional regulator